MPDSGDVAICTVHGNSKTYDGDLARQYPWPMLQLQMLRRFSGKSVKVFAYGNHLIEDHEDYLRSCDDVVFFSSREVTNGDPRDVWPIRNWLTRRALKEHKWVVHLDSDAFPIASDWLPRYCSLVSERCPVVAVKRLENGDHFSAPCFLMFSRDGFRAHAFDFSKVGVIDTGAGISAYLEEQGLAWYPLIRTNRLDYHRLIAGIYDDRIYHHGAGSRSPVFRVTQEIMLGGAETDEARAEVLTHRILRQWLFDHTDSFIRQLLGQESPRLLGEALLEARGQEQLPRDL
jgi:hypothetical protein